MRKLTLTFFLLLNLAYIFMKALEHDINLIENYVKQKNIPKNIIFYSCWSKKNSVKLMRKLANTGINFRTSYNFSKVDFHLPKKRPSLVISSAKCNDLNILIKKCEELYLLQIPFQWLILNGTSTTFDLNKEILLNTNFAVTIPKSAQKEIEVKSIYKTSENSTSFTENHLGAYSTTNNSFRNYRPLVIGVDRMDLMGARIRSTFIFPNKESEDFNFDNYRREDFYAAFKLYYVEVYAVLTSLNATAIDRIQRLWGFENSENSTRLTGMYGDLKYDLSEIGGMVSHIFPERLEYMDFLSIIGPFNLKFVFRKPPLSNIKNLFILPFDNIVWLCLFSLLVVLILSYFLLFFIENRMININNKEPIKDSKFWDVVLLQFGAITQQGTETEPKSGSVRIAFFVIFLALMFFYTAYSANIVVLLQSKSESIQTIKDMLDSKLTLGVEDLSYLRHHFKIWNDTDRKALYEQKVAPKGEEPHFYTYQKGIPRIRNEFFAFMFEGSMGYKLIHETFLEHEICGLTEVDIYNFFKPSLSLRKYSPYKRVLRIGFRKMIEAGLHHKLSQQLVYTKPPCLSDNNNFISVGIEETYFAFVIFFVGITIAILLLFMEILFQKSVMLWKKRQEQRNLTIPFQFTH